MSRILDIGAQIITDLAPCLSWNQPDGRNNVKDDPFEQIVYFQSSDGQVL